MQPIIKRGERFRRYRFASPDQRVRSRKDGRREPGYLAIEIPDELVVRVRPVSSR